MSGSGTSSNTYRFLPALVGAVLACTIAYFFINQMKQDQKNQSMEETIRTLQLSLEEKERELKDIRSHSRDQNNANMKTQERGKTGGGQVASGSATGSLQILKDLENVSDTDSRSS